jgi:hypothetical protein
LTLPGVRDEMVLVISPKASLEAANNVGSHVETWFVEVFIKAGTDPLTLMPLNVPV